MRTRITIFAAALWLAVVVPVSIHAQSTPAAEGKIRVLVVTGGHGFEHEPFLKLFQGYDDISFREVTHPKAHELFKAEAAKEYDVVVLYDMWANITDEAKADLVGLLNQGKPLVALHHCLASYQNWEEYAKIIGGKYWLKKRTEEGIEKPASTYKHDIDFTVHIADPDHPIVRGLKDFQIHDETYGFCEVRPESKPLLTTEEPTSTKTIGWTHTYGKARVVYIALGHDHKAYENPNYRALVVQSIRWAVGKP